MLKQLTIQKKKNVLDSLILLLFWHNRKWFIEQTMVVTIEEDNINLNNYKIIIIIFCERI